MSDERDPRDSTEPTGEVASEGGSPGEAVERRSPVVPNTRGSESERTVESGDNGETVTRRDEHGRIRRRSPV